MEMESRQRPEKQTSPMPSGGPNRKDGYSVPFKVAVPVVTALVTFVVLELVLRVTGFAQPEPRTYVGSFANREARYFVSDENVGWRMRPHYAFRWTTIEFNSEYRSNGDGFRADHEFVNNNNVRRIAWVGDSFTFGTGVGLKETYSSLVAQKFENAQALNLALPGYGLDQVLQSVRHVALPLQPDLIVVGIFPAMLGRSLNAYRPTEGFNKPTFRLEAGRLVRRTAEDRPGELMLTLERHSSVLGLLRRGLRGIGYKLPIGDWWRINAAIIEAIQEECRSANIDVLFVYVPSSQWRPFPQLEKLMRRMNANYVDLVATSGVLPDDIYYPIDGHLNADGHAFVAEALLRWIKENRPLWLTESSGI